MACAFPWTNKHIVGSNQVSGNQGFLYGGKDAFIALFFGSAVGQNIFTTPEDHRPLATVVLCAFGFHLLGPYTLIAHSGLVFLENVTMVPTPGIYPSLPLGVRDADLGKGQLSSTLTSTTKSLSSSPSANAGSRLDPKVNALAAADSTHREDRVGMAQA